MDFFQTTGETQRSSRNFGSLLSFFRCGCDAGYQSRASREIAGARKRVSLSSPSDHKHTLNEALSESTRDTMSDQVSPESANEDVVLICQRMSQLARERRLCGQHVLSGSKLVLRRDFKKSVLHYTPSSPSTYEGVIRSASF
jgi:hypothetical protein